MTYTPTTTFSSPDYCLSLISASESTLMPSFLTFDPETQTFSFDKIEKSLDLSGETFTEYSVTVNYKVFSFYDPATPTYDVN